MTNIRESLVELLISGNKPSEAVDDFIAKLAREGVITVAKKAEGKIVGALKFFTAPSIDLIEQTYSFKLNTSVISEHKVNTVLASLNDILASRMMYPCIDFKTATINVSTELPSTKQYIDSIISKSENKISSHLAGNRCAFVGIGGGSDGVQASILAELSGKPSCVISIRRGNRNVQNHGGEITKGVFLVTPETTTSGRFLEHLYSHKFKSYIVEDYENGELTNQIAAAMAHFGKVDTLYAVDTGGDALYKTGVDSNTIATPDQDIASLEAISQLKAQELYSVIIANGVDAPPYAAQVLADSKADQIFLTPDEAQRVLQIYRDYHLDGTDDNIFGKTCLAWQAALRGERGPVRLPLPNHAVNHPTNPWNPIVNITDEMAGIYVMSLKRHLAVLNDKQDTLNIDTKSESSLSL
jgi:hypothetical protein